MRVRTGRCRLDSEPDVSILFCLGGGDFEFSPCRFAPNPSMLPAVTALILALPTGSIGLDVLHRVEGFFIGSALHGTKFSGFEFIRIFGDPGSLLIVGSEEAHLAVLTSVRLPNWTCRFPASSFHNGEHLLGCKEGMR